MALYMVAYDLNTPGQDYNKVKQKLESLGPWCHYLESTYLIKSDLSFSDFQSQITSVMDKSDRALICESTGKIGGWLTDDNWKWISENLL